MNKPPLIASALNQVFCQYRFSLPVYIISTPNKVVLKIIYSSKAWLGSLELEILKSMETNNLLLGSVESCFHPGRTTFDSVIISESMSALYINVVLLQLFFLERCKKAAVLVILLHRTVIQIRNQVTQN